MKFSLLHDDRISWAIVVSAILLQIVLGTVLSRTNLPLCDEGFYGVPAHILSVTGELRNPVLESAGVKSLRGIDQHLYWMAPLGVVLQAAAFKLFGFGLLIQRGLSTFCALGAILFWHLALRHVVGSRVAAFSALLLSADFAFLSLSSRGRSDMISLFFAMGALAAYMHWREQSLPLALVAAHTMCALSGMVHPNGGIAALVSLAVLMCFLDRSRLKLSHLAMAAVLYGILGIGWGVYIAEAPELFVTQFFGNVGGRFAAPMTVIGQVNGEVTRYLSAYGLQDARGWRLVRYLLPVSYFGALLHCTCSTALRRLPGILLLILMFAGVSLSLAILEGAKQGWYLVHLQPFLAATLAVSASSLWKNGNALARMVSGAQVGVVLLGVASLTYSASNRNLEQLYQPATAFLNANVGPHDLVFARSEFYFGLKDRSVLRDDESLGYFSGKRATYIVIDQDYIAQLSDLERATPAIGRAIRDNLARTYHDVFVNRAYRIMRITTTHP